MELDCENCWYNCYDEDEEAYYCRMDIDEDEWARYINSPRARRRCPYFIKADEYFLSRKQ